mgnify:CR=1 FL=1
MVDAYALIGDVSGLAEKIQSFFMQEVLSVTHSVLKNILQEVCCCILLSIEFITEAAGDKQSEKKQDTCISLCLCVGLDFFGPSIVCQSVDFLKNKERKVYPVPHRIVVSL